MQIVLDDRGPQLAQLQKAAYPDVVPIMTTLRVAMAFSEALDVATSMPGWTIVASDIDAGRIEASQQSRWFGFTDDIVIRVVIDEEGSRIDVRSTSLQGRSDYGVNAARIRAYMRALLPSGPAVRWTTQPVAYRLDNAVTVAKRTP